MRGRDVAERSRQVLDREQAWTQAHRTLDVDVLEDCLSDEVYKLLEDGSLINKDQLLASLRSGARHWEIAKSNDHTVNFQRDTALLIGTWRGKGINNGTSFDYHARFVAVYVRENGAWKMLTEYSVPLDKVHGGLQG